MLASTWWYKFSVMWFYWKILIEDDREMRFWGVYILFSRWRHDRGCDLNRFSLDFSFRVDPNRKDIYKYSVLITVPAEVNQVHTTTVTTVLHTIVGNVRLTNTELKRVWICGVWCSSHSSNMVKENSRNWKLKLKKEKENSLLIR